MNRNNPETSIRRARDTIADFVSKAATRSNAAIVGLTALTTAGTAAAQATFDATTVTVVIAAMLAAGILIWTAWTAARWTLKAFGIVGGK
jgi:hypothetical protein